MTGFPGQFVTPVTRTAPLAPPDVIDGTSHHTAEPCFLHSLVAHISCLTGHMGWQGYVAVVIAPTGSCQETLHLLWEESPHHDSPSRQRL